VAPFVHSYLIVFFFRFGGKQDGEPEEERETGRKNDGYVIQIFTEVPKRHF
jgi:hypothetical protein